MSTPKGPTSLDELYRLWLNEAVEFGAAKGLTQEDIAAGMGLPRTAIPKMKRGKGSNNGRGISAAEAAKLSQVTGYPLPEHLRISVYGIMSDFLPLNIGVAAGYWREGVQEVSDQTLKVRRFEVGPEYAGLTQFARPIIDTHADLYAPKDFYLVCVDYHKAKAALNVGDRVTVERMREVDDTHLFELTVREIAKRDGKWFLDPLCSDPVRYKLEPIQYNGDTPTLRICDLIIARYAPN